ncbi:MAG: CPBP family intramembrane metalloprotease [Sphingomonas sp.]|nr:CPBP family intramembrane metalloprotease [Sphingomonas sp.]
MADLLATIALHWTLIGLLALAIRYLFRQPVNTVALAWALGCTLVYFVAVMLVGGLQAHLPLLAGLQFNWTGKTIAIVLTLVMMMAVPGATRQEFGLVLRQTPGSLMPAILVTAGLCAFAWGIRWLLGAHGTATPEALLYQATMPGLDEELFFRGLLLALLVRAFADRWPLGGAAIGPGAIVATFLFAAGHALMIRGGVFMFEPVFLAFSAVLGFGLLWIRQRTGSLLLPIIAHNIIDLGGALL